jgi:hypothetical protein
VKLLLCPAVSAPACTGVSSRHQPTKAAFD